jgi:hypothetical protein
MKPRKALEAHFLIATFQGALRHYGHLMTHLQRQGYEVHLWTMEPISEEMVDELVPGLTCHRLALVRGRHRVVDAVGTVAQAAALGWRRPDAIFSSWSIQTNLLCGLPLRALGRRCVFILAGMGSVFSSDAAHLRLARRLVVPAYRWMFGGARSQVIVQNRDDQRYVSEVLGVPREKVHLMHGCGSIRPRSPSPTSSWRAGRASCWCPRASSARRASSTRRMRRGSCATAGSSTSSGSRGTSTRATRTR